jgi:hypothetical protein
MTNKILRPVLFLSADGTGNESLGDINRAVNARNTNISCGIRKTK